MSAIREKFLQRLQLDFSTLTAEKMGPLISENLLSPFSVKLPLTMLSQAQEFVRICFQIRQSSKYRDLLQTEITQRGLIDPGNRAIAMSYDFHVNDTGELKLIEINTNASFLALGHWMYLSHELAQPVSDFAINEVRENIFQELKLFGNPTKNPRVSIVDDKPAEQKLFAEFLLYQEMLQSWGINTKIEDISQISPDADLIYNRSTDFFLDDEVSKNLRALYLQKKMCLSPNPFEYFLLADKQRMIDLRRPQFVDQLGLSPEEQNILWRHLPEASELSAESAEQIWSTRKKYFFKPKRSFGAKQSFKGASVSRRIFDELAQQGFLAQEYVAAPELKFTTPDGEQNFKYDLRFYVYQDRVQSVVARLYQGQVTNLRTPWGGFAPIIFS